MAARVDRVEVWGTAWGAPEDFTEFRGFAGGERIAAARIPGY